MFCTTCGSRMPDGTRFCTDCGAAAVGSGGQSVIPVAPSAVPASAPPRRVGLLLSLGIFVLPIIFYWFLMRPGYSNRARSVGFVWMLVMFLGSAFRSPDGTSNGGGEVGERPNAQAIVEQPAIAITAARLYAEYDANEIAADQQFKGKRLEVTGSVGSINSDIADNPVVTLSVNDQFGFGSVDVRGVAADVAAGLHQGQILTFICLSDGEIAGDPQLSECEVK